MSDSRAPVSNHALHNRDKKSPAATAHYPKIITVFEHQRLTVHDFFYGSDFDWLMTQELSVFSIKRKQGLWQLKVGHYIGIIVLPSGQSLEILPKLNQSVEDRDIEQARHWVQRMLSDLTSAQQPVQKRPNAKNFGQFSDQLTTLSVQALPLSEWLVAQFLQRLTRYQPTKHYQTQIHNQSALQGRLLIKEQLRYNSMQPHKFVCERSVLSQEMLSNRLIKSALVLLIPLLTDSVSAELLRPWQHISTLTVYEQQRLEHVYTQAKHALAAQPLGVQQRQAAQQLVDLAYWLLQQSAATGVVVGHNQSTKQPPSPARLCLLINMNQAFEQWASQRIAFMFEQQSARYRPLYQTQRVWLSDDAGQACLSIRPDLLIYQALDSAAASDIRANSTKNLGHYSHVIDIKWKPLSGAADMSASDAYQLSSYAQAYQAAQVWLVYPVLGHARQPVALTQQITHHKGSDAESDKPIKPFQLWLVPFDVLTGCINGGLLLQSNVV